MRTRMKTAVAAVAMGIAGVGMLGGTATADAGTEPRAATSWYTGYDSWNDPSDSGGVSFYEGAYKYVGGGKTEYVKGYFQAYGEWLTISDYHDNDRAAIVRLWVGGSGPAVFYGNGDGTERDINLSYDEGQTVYLQVCTSDSANAVCSPKKAKGVS
jgi:hypothetical protein